MIPAKYRQYIYAVVVVAMVVLFAAKVTTPGEVNAAIDAASSLVAALTAALAFANVNK